MKLNNRTKIILVIICLIVSIVGFLIKLPARFSQVDKELHSLFYFSAAAFLNILFANRNIIRHGVIFVSLYLFGIGIEYAQEYSNKFFHKRIHGRFDIWDVKANLRGLILFSILWMVCTAIMFAYSKLKSAKIESSKEGLV